MGPKKQTVHTSLAGSFTHSGNNEACVMSPRNVKLLHVEDELIQRRLIAHHLRALPEFAFEIVAVESESLAMEAFQQTRFELVILDYQLTQGNGLHLLGRLRRLDPMV